MDFTQRQQVHALLANQLQASVMATLPEFQSAPIYPGSVVPPTAPTQLTTLVFNMERGVHMAEIADFLQTCPALPQVDVILASELDDGCVRSGNQDTALALAQKLGFHYTYGLEFTELVNPQDTKGHHGNAIFSRYPITRTMLLPLPEQYNWYYDRQCRVGGRNAILAELNVGGQPLCVATVHLENRTHGQGRALQSAAVVDAVAEHFPHMPAILGGDYNTNTFDGRDTATIERIAQNPQLQQACFTAMAQEPLLAHAQANGYAIYPTQVKPTRRKPLPQGGHLELRLDWLFVRGLTVLEEGNLSTRTADCTFAKKGSALAAFKGSELSDHNAVFIRTTLGP